MFQRRFFPAVVLSAAVAATGSVELAAQAIQRSMYVSVVNDAGVPVRDLGPADFLVREDGVEREVLSVGAADAPMQIEILVDNSEAARDYIQDFRRGLTSFVAAMLKPNSAERRNEIGLVALADRPTILTQSTSDAAALQKGIDRLFSMDGTGNYLLDGIVDVSGGFNKRAAGRPVIVVITTEGPEFSSFHYERVLRPLQESGAALHVMVVGPPSRDQVTDQSRNRNFVLDRGPQTTGGRRENILTSMALEGKLTELATELTSQYRVTFARPESLIPPETTTVSVTKPGMTARGTLIREPRRP